MIRIGLVLVGLTLALYGLGAFGLSFITQMETTISWYKTVAMCVFGGLGLSVLGVYGNTVFSFLTRHISMPQAKDTKVLDPKIEVAGTGWSFLIEHYDHLGELAKTLTKQEDKDLCNTLRKRLLEIHHEQAIAEVK